MLYRINLLPWREYQRKAHRHRFVSLAVFGVMIAAIIQWGGSQYLQAQQAEQQKRLDYLSNHITLFDQRIEAMKIAEQEHRQVLQRLNVVDQLQRGRSKTTAFMNLIPSVIPEGVYVDKIKINHYYVELSGIADSTSHLATMLDNMERSAKLYEVDIHSIVHGKSRFGRSFQQFNVSFRLREAQGVGSLHHG